ncbi:hypothetical protein AVEN_22385-1, partial [Araneus ventricosus]
MGLTRSIEIRDLIGVSGRCGLAIRCRLRGRRVPGSKLDSTGDPLCIGLLHVKSYVSSQTPTRRLVRRRSLERRDAAQTTSSSSDSGSELRGPSQKSRRVVAKLDVNITKLLELRSLSPGSIISY